ncbi:1-acyl-sn-glycerol-3-phosphate acyltransferase [Pseudogulbenkiania sp. MAI-1]|uniref:lysophospholipid acyltransferase family protein n=1 Tax=Pseudogulbenkiania sp. MAI-1 TaxID=990370 RepID=UPI00045E5E75|nr:lysophospholipid acyltransferase family protein [Pseudogulbenkiania sp. MAI-1]
MLRLNYLWRLAMTGLAFALFSEGGLLLTLLVFPFLKLVPAADGRRCRLARRVIQRAFAVFIGFMCRVGIMTLEVKDGERLRAAQGMLVLANHPTLIDVVAIIARMREANCVVKAALWDSPFLGGVVRTTGYIRNDDSETLIADCARSLQQGDNLVIFPEGTRTVPGAPLKFQRGAAHIALASGAPILPVVLSCTPSTLTKDKRWYQIPPQRFHFTLEVGEPLQVAALVPPDTPSSLASRRLSEALQHYFSQALARKETVHEYAATRDQAADHLRA